MAIANTHLRTLPLALFRCSRPPRVISASTVPRGSSGLALGAAIVALISGATSGRLTELPSRHLRTSDQQKATPAGAVRRKHARGQHRGTGSGCHDLRHPDRGLVYLLRST